MLKKIQIKIKGEKGWKEVRHTSVVVLEGKDERAFSLGSFEDIRLVDESRCKCGNMGRVVSLRDGKYGCVDCNKVRPDESECKFKNGSKIKFSKISDVDRYHGTSGYHDVEKFYKDESEDKIEKLKDISMYEQSSGDVVDNRNTINEIIDHLNK